MLSTIMCVLVTIYAVLQVNGLHLTSLLLFVNAVQCVISVEMRNLCASERLASKESMDLLDNSDTDSSDDEIQQPSKPYRMRPFVDFERDRDFHERFRFTRRQVEQLLRLIGPQLAPRRRRQTYLDPEQKLLMALRFYASNGFYYSLGDAQGSSLSPYAQCNALNLGPSKTSMYRAVKAVTYVINNTFNGMICWPQTEAECRGIAAEFSRKASPGMPNVCGAIDGTLITITAPREFEANYVDRHGNHSINVLAVTNTQGRFLFLSARWPGSVHDARVYRNSSLAAAFDGGYRPFPNAILLGDSGFPASDHLVPMRPAAPEEHARFYRSVNFLSAED